MELNHSGPKREPKLQLCSVVIAILSKYERNIPVKKQKSSNKS